MKRKFNKVLPTTSHASLMSLIESMGKGAPVITIIKIKDEKKK